MTPLPLVVPDTDDTRRRIVEALAWAGSIRRAGLSEDRARRDECPRCRPDRPSPDTTPDGALL